MNDELYEPGSIIAAFALRRPAPAELSENDRIIAHIRNKLRDSSDYYVDQTGDDRTRCCAGIICTCRDKSGYDPTGD